jgi:hypothetical protein
MLSLTQMWISFSTTAGGGVRGKGDGIARGAIVQGGATIKRSYSSGWGYYKSVPSFYRGIPPGWRNDYREHRWKGHQWNHQRIPHQQLQRNWSNWEKNRHWEKQNTWGVQGLKPQRSQQPSKAVQQHPQATPQVREAAKPPQSREVQGQHAQPQHREGPQQPRPQPGEVQRQRSEPQHRDEPQQSKSRQGEPERGGEGKHDRR